MMNRQRNIFARVLDGVSVRLAQALYVFLMYLSPLLVVMMSARAATAAPTQDEVFRSINQNVGSTVDIDKWIPYILSGFGFVILVVLYNHRRQRQVTPRTLNHPGKLMKEICSSIELRPQELKQLKILAEDQKLTYPLTLLLCPSVMAKAVRNRSVQVDRQVIQQVVQRLRDGAGKKSE
jgi:hypothetical protein